jgi:hypothetical protein
MSPDDFYEWHDEPRQGDIVLCGVSRVIAGDHFSPPQWESLDAHFVHIEDAWDAGHSLGMAAGIGLAMVVTHDCQLDKEWDQRVRELQRTGMLIGQAEAEATADTTLDRTLVVSPLIDPSDLRGGRGNVMAGRPRDEYIPEGVFWVPPEARWGYLQANAKRFASQEG